MARGRRASPRPPADLAPRRAIFPLAPAPSSSPSHRRHLSSQPQAHPKRGHPPAHPQTFARPPALPQQQFDTRPRLPRPPALSRTVRREAAPLRASRSAPGGAAGSGRVLLSAPAPRSRVPGQPPPPQGPSGAGDGGAARRSRGAKGPRRASSLRRERIPHYTRMEKELPESNFRHRLHEGDFSSFPSF